MGASNTKCTNLDGTVFTQIEIDNYQKQRKNLFMSTIIICGIYAVLSLILILLGSFTNIGKELLFITYLPFTIVFIIGSIIIILYFSNKIYEFKPYKLDNNFKYDNNSCPDYWDLIVTPKNEDIIVNTPNDVNQGLFKYTCKASSNIYDKTYMLNKLNNDSIYNKGSDDTTPRTGTGSKIYSITGTTGGSADTYYTTGITSATTTTYDYNSLKNLKDTNHIYANLNDIPNSKFVDSNIKVDFEKNALLMAGFKPNSIGTTYYGTPLNTDSTKNYDIKYTSGAPTFATEAGVTNCPKIGGTATSETLAVPLLCDKLYPKLLAAKDDEYNKKNPTSKQNPHRCTYSRICGVSWSDVNCDYEKDI